MHYSALVFCSDPDNLDGMLERYHYDTDNTEYTEFKIEIEKNDIQDAFDNDSHLKDTKAWRERMDELVAIKVGNPKDYLMDYNGFIEDEDGNLGYWTNPDARMDYSTIGGRWCDELVLKKTDKINPNKRVDVAKVSSIDWEKTKDYIAKLNGEGYEQILPTGKKKISKKEFIEQYRQLSKNFASILCEDEGWIDEPDEKEIEDKIKYWGNKKVNGWVIVLDYHS